MKWQVTIVIVVYFCKPLVTGVCTYRTIPFLIDHNNHPEITAISSRRHKSESLEYKMAATRVSVSIFSECYNSIWCWFKTGIHISSPLAYYSTQPTESWRLQNVWAHIVSHKNKGMLLVYFLLILNPWKVFRDSLIWPVWSFGECTGFTYTGL